jgi:hypothetical protein
MDNPLKGTSALLFDQEVGCDATVGEDNRLPPAL